MINLHVLIFTILFLVLELYGQKQEVLFSKDVKLFDSESLRSHAQGSKQCTIVLAGAWWDGHFKHYVKSGAWNEIAEVAKSVPCDQQMVVGFIEYSGFKDHLQLPRITEDAWEYTISTYSIKIFREGRSIGNSNDLERFRALHGFEDQADIHKLLIRYCGCQTHSELDL